MFKNLGVFICLTILFSSLSVLTGNSSANAAKCKSTLVSQGKWTNYMAAKSSARVHWRRAARRLHGRKYGSWFRRARDKRYMCREKGYLRRCYAIARPCR